MKRVIIGIVAILLVSVVCTLWYKQTSHRKVQNQSSMQHVGPLPKEFTVVLNTTGFSPNTVTIHVGDAVLWKNESGDKETVNSDNYPTNQLHKELNFGIFNNNSSVVFTFTTPGTYGYHNQFHPEQKGEVLVTK